MFMSWEGIARYLSNLAAKRKPRSIRWRHRPWQIEELDIRLSVFADPIFIEDTMQFVGGHLADAANISVEGKLNLLGIFQKIGSTEFPCQLSCALVALFEADPFDRGTQCPVRIEFIDEDGQEMFRMEGMHVAVPDKPEHLLQTCNLIVNLRPLTL